MIDPDDLVHAAEQELLNPASISMDLESALHNHDVKGVWALAPDIAMLEDNDRADLRLRIKDTFGRDLKISDWDKEIKKYISKAKAKTYPDWFRGLIKTEAGDPKALLANAIAAIRHAPEWQGVLKYNEFALRVHGVKDPPFGKLTSDVWTDQQDRLTAEWLQHKQILVGLETAGQAVQTVAMEHSFHPVRDYLGSLVWDGHPRLNKWLTDCLATEDTHYTSQVGAKWMISAVARIYNPGCKADCALVLEGEQGIRKSTALMVLGRPWFTDNMSDLQNAKEVAQELAGAWIIEMAEMDSIKGSENSRIKAFMSRSADRYRPPYGRRVIDQPRQCIFAGTVNSAEYLKDQTGARRWWPVKCHGKIDIPGLMKARDQLWAEAVHRYKDKEIWWLEGEAEELAKVQQSERYVEDPWTEIVAKFITLRDAVTTNEILDHLQVARDRRGMKEYGRLARIMEHLGREKKSKWMETGEIGLDGVPRKGTVGAWVEKDAG